VIDVTDISQICEHCDADAGEPCDPAAVSHQRHAVCTSDCEWKKQLQSLTGKTYRRTVVETVVYEELVIAGSLEDARKKVLNVRTAIQVPGVPRVERLVVKSAVVAKVEEV
jgi:hypothetical protein